MTPVTTDVAPFLTKTWSCPTKPDETPSSFTRSWDRNSEQSKIFLGFVRTNQCSGVSDKTLSHLFL